MFRWWRRALQWVFWSWCSPDGVRLWSSLFYSKSSCYQGLKPVFHPFSKVSSLIMCLNSVNGSWVSLDQHNSVVSPLAKGRGRSCWREMHFAYGKWDEESPHEHPHHQDAVLCHSQDSSVKDFLHRLPLKTVNSHTGSFFPFLLWLFSSLLPELWAVPCSHLEMRSNSVGCCCLSTLGKAPGVTLYFRTSQILFPPGLGQYITAGSYS